MREEREGYDASVEFLLAEYGELNEERRRSRGEGPNRLNFFLAISSSVLGGLVLLGQVGTLPATALQGVAIAALAFLSLVGWDTFLFSLSRDIGTDFNIRATARIRRFFADRDPALRPYLSWQEHDAPTPYVMRNASSVRGTTQAILAVFAALIAGLAANLARLPLPIAVAAGLAAGLAARWWLRRYADARLARARQFAEAGVRFPPSLQSKE